MKHNQRLVLNLAYSLLGLAVSIFTLYATFTKIVHSVGLGWAVVAVVVAVAITIILLIVMISRDKRKK